jgi:hypothetical protein
MRNRLVLGRAVKHPKEQKLKWAQIAERLVDDDGASRNRFIRQEGVWNDLQQRLSRLAKSHFALDETELRSTFTKFLDHLYIVLSLVKLDPMSR